jgi:hypothetical protein
MHHDNSPGHTAFSAQHSKIQGNMAVFTHSIILLRRPLCLLLFPNKKIRLERRKEGWYHGDSTWIPAVLSSIKKRGLKIASSSGRGVGSGVYISKGICRRVSQWSIKRLYCLSPKKFASQFLWIRPRVIRIICTTVETDYLLFCWEDFAFNFCVESDDSSFTSFIQNPVSDYTLTFVWPA